MRDALTIATALILLILLGLMISYVPACVTTPVAGPASTAAAVSTSSTSASSSVRAEYVNNNNITITGCCPCEDPDHGQAVQPLSSRFQRLLRW